MFPEEESVHLCDWNLQPYISQTGIRKWDDFVTVLFGLSAFHLQSVL